MDDRYNYNYEDSFLTKEEKKNKLYNEAIEKNNKQQRKVFKIVFPILGLVYVIMGVIFLIVEEETFIPGIFFTCFGLLFSLLGIILPKAIKTKQYTNEEIEKKMNSFNSKSTYVNTVLHDARMKLLEDEIKELKDRIERLESKLK